MSTTTPEEIYNAAYSAGMTAGANIIPTPWKIGSTASPLSNEIDYSKPVYILEDGPCGFANIVISPARGKFVNWLKKNGIGHKHYYGGYSIWVHEFGQSHDRKDAFARAFSKVLKEYGITAHAESRLD